MPDAEVHSRKDTTSKVFVSYSRKDMAFVDRLEAALKAQGIEPLIDRTEIYAFEDWWKRIESLIAQADTVVFVLSPDSVTSEVALREVAFAATLNKRFAPIVARRVDSNAVPEPLRRLNFIFFDEDAAFDASAHRLVEALSTDIAWIRRHTDFGEAARRWATAGRPGPRGLLLRSPTLEDAERWIASRPDGAPAPTADVQDFIAASRSAATRRRNVLSAGLGGGLLVALALAGLAYWQRGLAVEQRDKALITQSRFLADLSRQFAERGDQTSALLLAMEALPDPRNGVTRPLVPAAEDALYQSLVTLREIAVLSAPGTKIKFVSVNEDSSRILTQQEDGSVRIWDANTYRLLATHDQFGKDLRAAFFDHAGTRVVIVTKDLRFQAIDPISGEKLNLPVFESRVIAGLIAGNIQSISKNWRRVVHHPLAAADLDPDTGIERNFVALESAATEQGREFRMSDDGSRIVSDHGTVWDALTGKVIARIDPGIAQILSKAHFSPDGTKVVWQNYPTAFLYDIATKKVRKFSHPESKKIKGHERDQATVHDTDFTSDGTWLATASADRTARIWNVASGDVVAILEGHRGEVREIEFLGGRTRLQTRSDDGTVRIWASVADNEVIPPQRFEGKIVDAFFRKDAVWLVVQEKDNSVVVWDYTNNSLVATLAGHTRQYGSTISRADIDPDGRRIITAIGDNTARVWNLETGAEISRVEVHAGAHTIHDLGFSRDGRLAYAAADDLYVWEVDSGRLLTVIQSLDTPDENGRHTYCASFNPDGSQIVTASDSATRIWDVATGQTVRQLTKEWLACARYSPDGRHILTVREHGENAEILDAQSGAVTTTLTGHQHFTTGFEWSPDGRLILTRSEDTTVRLWDAQTGRLLRVLTDIGGMISARFTPDGNRILTQAGGPSYVEPWRGRLWPFFADTASMMDRAKALAPRCLTRDQRLPAFLDADPPAWCIEMEKWPYNTPDWKDRLRRGRVGQ